MVTTCPGYKSTQLQNRLGSKGAKWPIYKTLGYNESASHLFETYGRLVKLTKITIFLWLRFGQW